MITVFTPTFNRRNELERLYQSLKEQDFKDFEWVIVDDGSTDDTEQLVNNFSFENEVKITYHKQENKGKSIAHNKGVQLAKGNVFVGIDSDDVLVKGALKKINTYFEEICDKDDIAGIGFLNYKLGTYDVIGSQFPNNKMIDTYYNIYNKYNVTGDKEIVFKTSVLKEFLFPIFENEKFVPEALLFNRICKKYKLLWVNEAVKYVQYLNDGYSANYFLVAKKSPRAHMTYYKELYEYEKSNYNIAAYDMYAIYAKYGILKAVKEHPSRLKSLLMLCPAYIKYIQKELRK